MKKNLKNWFYKDSRLVITKKESPLPDGGYNHSVKVNMLTFSPAATTEKTLTNAGDSSELIGSYGLNPWDIFNPFKENQNIAWLMMYNQGLIKDVTAELIHSQFGSFLVTVNNPQVGKPYIVFFNSPIEAVIPSPLVGEKIYLDEGDNKTWTSKKGWTVSFGRRGDSDNKEFYLDIK